MDRSPLWKDLFVAAAMLVVYLIVIFGFWGGLIWVALYPF